MEHINGLTVESIINLYFILSLKKKRYEGYWRDGKQNGKGKYILQDGSIRSGVWEDGKRIRWDDEET